MFPLAWRALSVFLAAVVVLQFYLLAKNRENTAIPSFLKPPQSARPSPQSPVPATWVWNADRDSSNLGLSLAQCNIAFPKLYDEIDRAASYWQKRKPAIQAADIDILGREDAAVTVLIHNNQLSVTSKTQKWKGAGIHKRVIYVLSQLNRALLGATAAGETLPTVEFAVTVSDLAPMPANSDTHTIFAFARRIDDIYHERLWLIPDFTFFASPPTATTWLEMQRRARSLDLPISEKIPKAVWRGVEAMNKDVRGNLLRVANDQDWADVSEMSWEEQTSNIMATEDFCRYMFVVHTEGRSWSARLKYLLNCNSVPIVHQLEWTTWYYHLLVSEGPEQNHVAVARDFSDLEEKVYWYTQHQEKAQLIADNAVSTFRSRYTTLAAESCYWRRLIQAYSEVSFVPEPFEEVAANVSGERVLGSRLRGTSYEEVLVER